ncbi:50S ribosomal protein L11 methyltransferase [Bosea sp. AAP35]|uniref:class I SAM-dependent methyltransferase n=1 Tax=Bosea sp. AAP35 TaxID=1523417 RepID=UPI0006B99BDE|nr:methyltransferase [Bosea sp. AAP35]KPF67521.1 50S ribosomal protein L11 methyltransferase [Bosea sp. AAP35]
MSAPPLDRRAFIVEHTRLLPVPHAPEISLHVAQEATELWQKTEDELAMIGLPPPFWAFAWAGGQALARYLLDNPGIVHGLRVLDFASGSGLVAIAVAKCGASPVEACDIDAFAAEAIALNALANGVSVTVRLDDLVGRDEGWDVVCAGDICYERTMAHSVIAWLTQLASGGTRVLIGDPGRSYLPRDRLEALASYDVPVTRSLEDADIKHSTVWQLKA